MAEELERTPELRLLGEEYRRRMALSLENRLVADWRLQEGALLLCRQLKRALRGEEAPDAESLCADYGLREGCRLYVSELLEGESSNSGRAAALLAFHRFLFQILRDEKLLRPENLFPPFRGEEKICYVRNYFSDAAFDRFFPYLHSPTALYADNFSVAADVLEEEGCSAVIFPYETEDGHMLRGIETILLEYSFKKEMICSISSLSGNTSYALFRKKLTFLPGATFGEFLLPDDAAGASALYTLSLYAADCGAVTKRVEVSPRPQRPLYRFLFSGGSEALLQLYLLLSLEYPDFSAGGFYKILPSSGPEDGAKD